MLEQQFGVSFEGGILLCGSFSTGEESIILDSEPPVLLSDVDLVAIFSSCEEWKRWSRRRKNLGKACETLLPEIEFCGHVEVGAMTAADLEALPARPGVLEIKARGKILSGDLMLMERIPHYEPEDIPANEAAILIENRMASLLGTFKNMESGATASALKSCYEISRVYTDIATAALSFSGMYVIGYRERANAIEQAVEKSKSPIDSLVNGNLAEKISRWTEFKLAPSMSCVFSMVKERPIEEIWREAAADISNFHDRLVKNAVSKDLMRERFSSFRCGEIYALRSGSTKDRFNAWRGYLSYLTFSRAVSTALSLGPHLLSVFPEDIVRGYCVKLLKIYLESGSEVIVKRPMGGFPFSSITCREAFSELFDRWRELVFGREG